MDEYHIDVHDNNEYALKKAWEEPDLNMELIIWLLEDQKANIHIDNEWIFIHVCEYGLLETAKWLVSNYRVDVHADNEMAFCMACSNNKIEIAKWLVNDHQVNVSLENHQGNFTGATFT